MYLLSRLSSDDVMEYGFGVQLGQDLALAVGVLSSGQEVNIHPMYSG
jgi:hypothetical protein